MAKSKLLTRKLAIGVIGLALAGSAGWYALSEPAGESALTDLDAASFAQIRNEFNEAVGSVRIIALLSPT